MGRPEGDPARSMAMTELNYAEALYSDDGATLDDLREAVTMLEDLAPTARRVLGGTHPVTTHIEISLEHSHAMRAARETPSA